MSIFLVTLSVFIFALIAQTVSGDRLKNFDTAQVTEDPVIQQLESTSKLVKMPNW